jgi:hypothetical protein
MGLLEDASDAVGGDDCGDTLAWLTAREERIRCGETRGPGLGTAGP